MAFFNDYPYTDFHELNLDWILKKIKEIDKTVNDFTVFNTITWAGEWSAAKSYVKWAIVQDENGNGYISLQAVPQNVALTNEDYWVRVANYDILWAAFNERINTNASNITAETSAREAADTALGNRINTNASNITALGNRITTNANDISRLSNLNAIVIGDSYGTDYEPDGTTSTPWQDIVNNMVGFNIYHKIGVGGIGFYGGSGTFLAQLQTLTNSLTSEEKENINTIIVGGGANDFGASETNISSAINTFVTYCKNNYTNASIYIAFMGGGVQGLVTSDSWINRATVSNIHSAYISYERGARESGVNFINCGFWARINNFSTDYIHPNANGKTAIAIEVVLGLNKQQPYIFPETPQTESGIKASIDRYGLHIIASNAFNGSFTGTSTYVSTTFYSGLIPMFPLDIRIHCSSLLTKTGGGFEYAPTILQVANGELRASFPVLNDSKNGWRTVTGSLSGINVYSPLLYI